MGGGSMQSLLSRNIRRVMTDIRLFDDVVKAFSFQKGYQPWRTIPLLARSSRKLEMWCSGRDLNPRSVA